MDRLVRQRKFTERRPDGEKREVIVENAIIHPIEQTIAQALRDLRFGSVEIIVHDSKIVQIERREKMRVEQDRSTYSVGRS